MQTCTAKQRFGYVESDEVREVTHTRHNCDQTQCKGLNIRSDIFVNVAVLNLRFVTQIPKVALDYDVDLSRYCATRKFYSDLRCHETHSHRVQNTYIFYVGPKFTDCFLFHVRTLHSQSNYVLCSYSVRQRSYKQHLCLYFVYCL